MSKFYTQDLFDKNNHDKLGIHVEKMPENLFSYLKDNINTKSFVPHNSSLAGNIKEEYNIYNLLKTKQKSTPIDCVLIDEAQFLSKDQVWQLARAVDDLFLPVICYGLRVDFQGNLFPGSAALLGLADELKEAGFIDITNNKEFLIPGYYDPFIFEDNIINWSIKYTEKIQFLVTGDCDQDRPNTLKNCPL